MISRTIRQLLTDETGSVDSAGYIALVTLIGIGMITGLATLRDGIVQEYGDISLALEHLDQSYEFTIPTSAGLVTITFDDGTGAIADDVAGAAPGGIILTVPPTPGTGESADLPIDDGLPAGESRAL